MQAFVINLDSATDRWAFIEESFAHTGLTVHRISAVDGGKINLPIAEFSQRRFRWFHGRRSKTREIGCYLSHIKALRAFLDSGDEFGLICEDDVRPSKDLVAVLQSSLLLSKAWDILRLSSLGPGTSLTVCRLSVDYRLCVSFGRLNGSGAYVVNRAAASTFVQRLLPMWLPYDHAFDREWFYGLRAVYVLPFPCPQTESRFPSSIQPGGSIKLPEIRRWLTTYPYQAFNEVMRWGFRATDYLRARYLCADVARDSATSDGDARLRP